MFLYFGCSFAFTFTDSRQITWCNVSMRGPHWCRLEATVPRKGVLVLWIKRNLNTWSQIPRSLPSRSFRVLNHLLELCQFFCQFSSTSSTFCCKSIGGGDSCLSWSCTGHQLVWNPFMLHWTTRSQDVSGYVRMSECVGFKQFKH